ncbi:hypothetical protein HDU77_003783 [Chytriomyces hyalinus]|nr:hypothetical protein HDU77_003783 [Chytriomyces hyalinus]
MNWFTAKLKHIKNRIHSANPKEESSTCKHPDSPIPPLESSFTFPPRTDSIPINAFSLSTDATMSPLESTGHSMTHSALKTTPMELPNDSDSESTLYSPNSSVESLSYVQSKVSFQEQVLLYTTTQRKIAVSAKRPLQQQVQLANLMDVMYKQCPEAVMAGMQAQHQSLMAAVYAH